MAVGAQTAAGGEVGLGNGGAVGFRVRAAAVEASRWEVTVSVAMPVELTVVTLSWAVARGGVRRPFDNHVTH